MGVRESFIADIVASPDDDGVRLVFSDWLEENGEPERAEFIRVQIALAKMPPHMRERGPLERREAELLRDNQSHWLWELPRWACQKTILEPEKVGFRRGFAAHFSTTEKRLLDNGDELFAVTPAEGFSLRRITRDLGPLAAWRHLHRLRRLDLTFTVLRSEGVRQLAAAPGACNLTELVLDANRLTGAAVCALLESEHLAPLERLSLRTAHLRNDDVLLLADTRGAARLRSLNLHDNRLCDDGLAALASSPFLRNLTDLDIGATQVTTAGVAALAGTPLLANLTRLVLPSEVSRPAEAVAKLNHRLAELHLTWAHVGDPGAVALAESPASAHLRSLSLYGGDIGNPGCAAIANSPHLANLTRLNLGYNLIGAKGVRALAESPHLGGLLSLDLYGNSVGRVGARLLRERFGDRVRV